jgi:hypothetical protein
LTGRAVLLSLALLSACREERLPSYTQICRDRSQVTSYQAMPDERVCDGHGGVANSLTIVESDPKRR